MGPPPPTTVETSSGPKRSDGPHAMLDLDVPPQFRCPVRVEAVVSDERHRGSPDTPRHAAWVEQLSPEDRETYEQESPAESFRQCDYRIVVAERPWRFVQTWNTTLEDLPPAWCEEARAFVAAEVQRVTLGCTQLHRGAYYGEDLVPLGEG